MDYKYSIIGMSCIACKNAIENAVRRVDGVTNVQVNLMENYLTFSSEKENIERDVFSAIKKAGFKAKRYTKESTSILRDIIISLVLTLILVYFMVSKEIGLPYIKSSFITLIIEAALSLSIIIINFEFYIRGFKGIVNLNPSMDTLISIGSLVAFLYSLYVLIFDNSKMCFFEASSMVLVVVKIGKYLESKAKGRTLNALNNLRELMPLEARVQEEGVFINKKIDDVKVGDIVEIKEGENIPVDGIIVSGSCTINESLLTGESLPLFKREGDKVTSATVLEEGYILVKVSKVHKESSFSKIIDFIESAENSKPEISSLVDKISKIFVPVILLISILVFIIWILTTKDFGRAIEFCVSTLVISCPCALGLATPVAITCGVGKFSENGILVKNAKCLENVSKIEKMYFDKTGTLTLGVLSLESVEGLSERDKENISSIESKSSHPMGKAICKAFKSNSLEITNLRIDKGLGITGTIDNHEYKIGNSEYTGINSEDDRLKVFVLKDDIYLGKITFNDKIKEEGIEVIESLRELGIKTGIISGDNESVTKEIATILKVDDYKSNVTPENKLSIISSLRKDGIVGYIGDGVNDVGSILEADVGFSFLNGLDISVLSSDIVLTTDLMGIVKSISLGKKVRKIIKENLFWASIYNLVMIPVASGALYSLGIVFSPVISSVCMCISSIVVVLNSLRILK